MRTGHRALTVAALLAVVPVLTPVTASAAPPLPDSSRSGQWWFTALQVSKIWSLGAQGQGVTVAVLDTGVNANRPEVAGHVKAGIDLLSGGDGRTDADRQIAHGTAMATRIVGQGGPSGLVGIAPSAAILPVRVINGEGQNGGVDGDKVNGEGIRYAADHGAKVISLSLGDARPCGDVTQAAVAYAVSHGAVVVAAAGNQADGPAQSPADCAGVLAVGAVDADRRPWVKTNRQPYVDVAGPGVDLPAIDANGGRGTAAGTSDATALTAAALALIWSKFPSLTNRQVVARLLATVRDDAAQPGRDDATGYGVIRPYNAITTNVPADAPNPVFDELNGVSTGSTGSPGPTTGGGTSPSSAAPAPAPSTPVTPVTPGAKGRSEGGTSSTVVIAIVAALAVLLVSTIAMVAILRSRRRRAMTPPPPQWPQQPPPWR